MDREHGSPALARTSLSLVAAVASIATLLAVATTWLLFTNPVGVASAVNEGQVSPLVRELAGVLASALNHLLRWL